MHSERNTHLIFNNKMKKIIVIIAAACISFAANAQLYVGGAIHGLFNDNTSIGIYPEAGYALNETFTVGAALDFDTRKDAYTSFGINPYLRWNCLDLDPVKVFVDCGFMFVSFNNKAVDKSYTAFQLGVRPGFAIPLNDNLSFVSHVGFLGYTVNDNNNVWTISDEGFGIDLSGYNVTCGLYYNF